MCLSVRQLSQCCICRNWEDPGCPFLLRVTVADPVTLHTSEHSRQRYVKILAIPPVLHIPQSTVATLTWQAKATRSAVCLAPPVQGGGVSNCERRPWGPKQGCCGWKTAPLHSAQAKPRHYEKLNDEILHWLDAIEGSSQF
ncbi:hypothetical protein IF2G_00916 [Cordyceps javanica]|nr:hypothetical protein IF2G_00916 [Cordyceps javanica]